MIWTNEKITLYNADCFDIFPQIDNKSVDLILADLPYGTTACKWDTILPFDKLWQAYERIIKDNGAIVLTASQPFTSALVMSNPKKFKYQWVWEKGTASNFANANYQPLKSHEDVLVFGSFPASPTKKGLKNYNPQFEKGKPYICKAGLQRSDSYLRSGAASLRGGNYQTINDGFRYPKSVIKILKDKDKLHPTQKPVALFEYLIKTYTNEGDLVLDNTFGSGTTAVACQNLNRQFVGMEKEKKYLMNLMKN